MGCDLKARAQVVWAKDLDRLVADCGLGRKRTDLVGDVRPVRGRAVVWPGAADAGRTRGAGVVQGCVRAAPLAALTSGHPLARAVRASRIFGSPRANRLPAYPLAYQLPYIALRLARARARASHAQSSCRSSARMLPTRLACEGRGGRRRMSRPLSPPAMGRAPLDLAALDGHALLLRPR